MAETQRLIKLSDILLSAEQLPWQRELFLPSDRNWTLDTEGALLDTEDEEDPANPILAQTYGLIGALGTAEIQDIVSNAKQQNPKADVSRLLQAFLFYFANDAFIRLLAKAPRLCSPD